MRYEVRNCEFLIKRLQLLPTIHFETEVSNTRKTQKLVQFKKDFDGL